MSAIWRLLVDTVRLLSPSAGTDGHGNPVEVFDADGGTTVAAKVIRTDTSEPVSPENVTESTWSVWLRPGSPVTSRTRVVWQGTDYEVVGEPWEVVGLGGRESHVELRMRRAR